MPSHTRHHRLWVKIRSTLGLGTMIGWMRIVGRKEDRQVPSHLRPRRRGHDLCRRQLWAAGVDDPRALVRRRRDHGGKWIGTADVGAAQHRLPAAMMFLGTSCLVVEKSLEMAEALAAARRSHAVTSCVSDHGGIAFTRARLPSASACHPPWNLPPPPEGTTRSKHRAAKLAAFGNRPRVFSDYRKATPGTPRAKQWKEGGYGRAFGLTGGGAAGRGLGATDGGACVFFGHGH